MQSGRIGRYGMDVETIDYLHMGRQLLMLLTYASQLMLVQTTTYSIEDTGRVKTK